MIVACNIRGFNQILKQKELKVFLSKNNVIIITINEHIVRADKASSIINKVMSGWSWVTNATSTVRGKIWVAWNPDELIFIGLETTEQYIHGKFYSHTSGVKFLLTAVYGLHTIADRLSLWSSLRTIHAHVQKPW